MGRGGGEGGQSYMEDHQHAYIGHPGRQAGRQAAAVVDMACWRGHDVLVVMVCTL